MNIKNIFNILGRVLVICAVLMLPCIGIALIYKEAFLIPFLIPILTMSASGTVLLKVLKPDSRFFFAKDGLVTVALSWIVLSIFGALPLYLSGTTPTYLDALFETVSGFTTTGATIYTNVEVLPRSVLFWRSFTHWIGGMGVLVFMLAILPKTEMSMMHILKAESPGPKVGKLVSKTRSSARILYGIYMVMTLVLIVLLLFGKMPLFDAVVNAFATAGTGGFGILNSSIAGYNSLYCEIVIGIFMLLFGINFNLFYLILLGQFRRVLKSEELRTYLTIVSAAILLIAWNITNIYGSFAASLRYSFFQVSSIMTTTGFATADFNLWPPFSKIILLLLMFVGGCAGSTGGGIKIARIVIIGKSIRNTLKKVISPRSVTAVSLDGETIEEKTVKTVSTYLCAYVFIVCISTLIIALDKYDGVTSFTAVMACFNNIGPGLNEVGPSGNFAGFAPVSKIVLILNMLFGRLEIFPMMTLFSLSAWKKN